MSTLSPLDAATFRREMAGLADVEARGVLDPLSFREAASDFACALAIVFNRDALDAMTLWSRISSAIDSGLPVANDGDLERFESHCLDHIKATPSRVVSDERYAALTEPLRNYDDEQRAAFLRYLSDHLMPVAMFGRRKWEQLKADKKQEAT